MEYALYANGISKYFQKKKNENKWALQDVNLRIKEGEIFGLLGPNGSGKSTFIRIASTLLIPDKGHMEVFGHDVVKEADKVKWLINRVSVEASFFRMLSAMENLLFSAGLYGIPKVEAIKKILEICERIDLDKTRLNDRIKDFSRGMQQKVAIARAFLTSPPLMLLDEPTTGLDPRAKREVQGLIEDMKKNLHTTILLTSHDMEEIEKLCNYVAIIHNGKIAIEGTPEALKTSISDKTENPTFEDVFMAYTGVDFKEAEKDEEEDIE
jgi:ABC-2 type transport system ATP-binding protein